MILENHFTNNDDPSRSEIKSKYLRVLLRGIGIFFVVFTLTYFCSLMYHATTGIPGTFAPIAEQWIKAIQTAWDHL